MRKKIWVFAFEYAGIAKVGGLGEVSANQCKNLVGEPELDLHVFMPSHGRHKDLQEKLNLKPLTNSLGKKVVLKGRFDPLYFGFNIENNSTSENSPELQSITNNSLFEVEIWTGSLDSVPISLLVGKSPLAAQILNDREVYGSSTLNAKLGLFSLAMREYMRHCIYADPSKVPSLIHIHDHHPVAALLCCRQELNLARRDVESIITMHLLTWPRRDLEFFWKSGSQRR